MLLVFGAVGGQAADSFSPTTVNVTLAPGASWQTSQTLHLDSLPPRADIVLAVDTTGSMGAAITDARSDATGIVNRIKSSIPGSRFAVVDFKDYPLSPFGNVDDFPYRLVRDLTGDPAVVEAGLGELVASGGGDLPESINRVFYEAYSDPALAYAANTPRFLVVLADDIGHDSTQQTTFSACPNTFHNTVDGAIPLDDPGRDGTLGTSDDLRTKQTLDALKANNTNVSFVTYNPGLGTPGTADCHAQMAAYTGGIQATHETTDSLADEIVTIVKQAAARVDEVQFEVDEGFESWVEFSPPLPYGPFVAPRDIPYDMKITVPAGTVPGTYTFSVRAAADGSSRAEQVVTVRVRSLGASGLTLSVDERSIAAGIASLPFSSLPASRIPFLGGTTSALPAGSIPAGSIPAGSIPAGSIPAGSIPAGSIPAGSIGLGDTPAGSIPAGSIALSHVLLSQIPLRAGATWDAITAGTSLADQPLNALTFQHLATSTPRNASGVPLALERFNALQLKQIDLATSLWRGAPFAALMLGKATLSQVGPPPGYTSWADALEANGGSSSGVDPATNTVFGVYVAGQLGSTPAGSIPAGSIPAGSIPAGSIPAGSIELNMTRLGAVRIDELVPVAPKTLSAYVNCSGTFDCTDKTLGEADAAGAINSTLTLDDLFAALPAGHAARATTVDQLIMAMLSLTNYPWEQIAVEGLQDVAAAPNLLHYHVDFDLGCSAGTTFEDVTVNLPRGFMPVLGSTRFSYGGGAAVAGRNPEANDSGDFVFTPEGTDPCGTATGTRHVRMDFDAYPGLTLGDHTSDATVTTDTQTQTVNDRAPVLVTQNHEPNDDPLTAPLIEKNTLVVGHVADSTDKEYFRFNFGALPRHSKLVAYLNVPDGADFDLVVHKQFSPSLQSSPAGSIPAGSIPVEDQGVSVDNSRQPLPPETLADVPAGSIPAGSIPAGSIPAGSISANRGSANEAAQVVKRDEPGDAIISVSGFNASHSNRNYVLRLQVVEPPPLPDCPDVTGLATAPAGTLPTPSSLPLDTQTLFLVNRQRLTGLYGQAADDLFSVFSPLDDVAARAEVNGAVIPVDGDLAVRNAYAAWDDNPCSVDAANTVVRRINDVIARYRAALPQLKYLVVLGTDEVIPMYRQDDLTSLSPELDEANDLAFTTSNLTEGNALYASAAQNTVLTDGAYAATSRLTWLGHDLPLAQTPISRLVETPQHMSDQFQQYLDSNGELNPTSELTTGYDFLTDGANDIHSALVRQLGSRLTAPDTLISDGWGRSDFLGDYFAKTPAVPDVVSPNAHYSHWLAQPATPNPITDVLTQMVNTGDVPGAAQLAGRLVFVMGCHSGLNVPNTLGGDATRLKDWAESYLASKTAVYVAQTGFGYGDTVTNALTERLLTLFAEKLNSGSTSVGEQWIEALQSYYLTAGAYDVFDEKAMIEATFYGLPFYRFGGAPTPPPAPPAPPTMSPDGSVGSVTLTPSVGRTERTLADGRKWWEIEGQTLNIPYRPIQPVTSRDVTVPGKTARGLFITSLTTHDVANVKPLRAYPVVDLKAHEPDPEVENIFFPANFATLLRTGDRASASIVAGQFRPNTVGNPNLGTQRLVDSIGLDVSYVASSSTPTDSLPPQILQVGGVIVDGGTRFFVRASDTPGPIQKVAVLYNTGTPVWSYLELAHQGGDLWTGFVGGLANPGVQIIAQARDASGLTGIGANKAQNYISSVDQTDPSIQIDFPRPGAVFTLNQQVTPKFACSDGGAVEECAGAVLVAGRIDTTTAGEHTFTVTATDLAGNTTTKSVTYRVVYTFSGFRPPVNNQPTLNVAKAGSTIPVKWQLKNAAGAYVSDLNSVTSVTSETLKCPGAATEVIEETTTATLVPLTYDTATNQFVYTWQTDKRWAGTCRRLHVALVDGLIYSADFRFK
ncbi:MAG TPA: PxKF domain-containing protein [Gaiellaceae bacterium]|nr:PxKF domain-containing protein [Gaiellaceae bacterium]